MRDEESSHLALPRTVTVPAIARSACHCHKTYIVTGGTGGFGLELAQWLVSRGATKIFLTSRTGVSNGYQARKIRRWLSSGIDVKVLKLDVSDMEQAEALIAEATVIGPVGGVFNLAMVGCVCSRLCLY